MQNAHRSCAILRSLFHNVFCGAQADIVVGREDIEAHGFQVPASLPDYPGFFEREERASKVDFRHVAIAVPLNRRYPANSGPWLRARGTRLGPKES